MRKMPPRPERATLAGIPVKSTVACFPKTNENSNDCRFSGNGSDAVCPWRCNRTVTVTVTGKTLVGHGRDQLFLATDEMLT